ncbi:MAG: UvrB/UvrC motif-containing protein [Desulfobacterales bacterium]|nr:UvrB/UvrC motif-containing protein [Desulfobacterales bacterium]
MLFLKGRTQELIRKIRGEMEAAAAAQEYEKAARLRDKLFALQRTTEKQVAVTTDFMDRDVFAAASADGAAVITHLEVRGGFLTGTRHFGFPETMAAEDEMLGRLHPPVLRGPRLRARGAVRVPRARGRGAGSRSGWPPRGARRCASTGRSAARRPGCWRWRCTTPARSSKPCWPGARSGADLLRAAAAAPEPCPLPAAHRVRRQLDPDGLGPRGRHGGVRGRPPGDRPPTARYRITRGGGPG